MDPWEHGDQGHVDPATAAVGPLAELPESEVTAVLLTIAHQARALVRADYVALGIGTDPERPFDPWVFVGISPATAGRIGRVPRPVGLLGAVAHGGEVIRCGDLRRDPRFRGLPRHHPDMASFLGVPLRRHGEPMGNLYLSNKPGHREFSDSDERLITALAASAAVMIETAGLYATEKRQRAWLQSVIDQMPDAVLLYDERCRLTAKNQACAGLCQVCSDVDRYGNPVLLDLRTTDGRALGTDELPMVQAFETGEVILDRPFVLKRPDCHFMSVSVSALPVRAASGTISGVMVIVEDITERMRNERMREEWSAVIAHDLRQPVQTISLAADLLLKRSERCEDDRKLVERIRSAVSRLGRMVSDLTDASLIESQRLSINRKEVDVGALVQSFVDALEAAPSGHDVRVKIEGARKAWIDPDRIGQVLGNLFSNAVKYSRPGSEIVIEALGHEDDVELVVTNQGRGIPAEQLPLLFSRFERAGEHGTSGLGLGLYIAKGLVEAHGGRIWVESRPNETTSFHVRVPRRPSP